MRPEDDWIETIQAHVDKAEAEFDLTQLRPGDILEIVTAHSTYRFAMLAGREANLDPGRMDRPSGKVRILGCTFGDSSSIKPDHLFCGGNLSFNFMRDGVLMEQRTTSIKEIRHIRSQRKAKLIS